jgi:hypothetical protein
MRKAEAAATKYFTYALIERHTLIEAFFTLASNPSIGR